MMSSITTPVEEPNGETLSKRYLRFLTSGEHADITLIVGKDKIPIKAHKLILMLGSSYFEELLTKKEELVASSTGEAKQLNIGSGGNLGSLNHPAPTGITTYKQMDSLLVIEDVDLHDFDLFLQFLYSRSVPDDVNTALPLLIYATKFHVPSLIEAAGNLLKQSLNLKSALTVLQQAVHFKCQELQASTLDLICKNAYKILKSPKFPDLSEEAVGLILQKNELRAYDEMQVFEAAIRWAQAECGRQEKDPASGKDIRSVLELLLKFIRFPLMNASEFPTKVARFEILTAEERVDILESFITPAAPRFSEFFPIAERVYYIPETPTQVVKVGGASSTTSFWDFDLKPQSSIMFRVNKDLWISKIGFCPWYSWYSLPMLVTLELKNANANDIPNLEHKVAEMVTTSLNRHSVPVSVEFKTPAKIRASTWYTIAAYFSVQGDEEIGQIQCCEVYTQHTTGIRKVVCAEVGDDDPLCLCFEFQSTVNNNGQIAEIGYKLED